MKEQEAKELEQLVAKAMQKSSLETPSFQFTDKVMAAINAQQQSTAIRYSPLIPKYIWVSIVLILIGITGYLWFLVQPTPLDLESSFTFNFMKNSAFSKEISTFTPSKVTVYAFFLLALMLCVQIPVLKRYFDKQ